MNLFKMPDDNIVSSQYVTVTWLTDEQQFLLRSAVHFAHLLSQTERHHQYVSYLEMFEEFLLKCFKRPETVQFIQTTIMNCASLRYLTVQDILNAASLSIFGE